jgi:hypothetical protein
VAGVVLQELVGSFEGVVPEGIVLVGLYCFGGVSSGLVDAFRRLLIRKIEFASASDFSSVRTWSQS